MERAYRNAERYHKDHYNPTFYIEERERAILLFLFLFDTFGVLVVEFPAAIHTIPAVISNTFLFTPYFIFYIWVILLIQGTKIGKICSQIHIVYFTVYQTCVCTREFLPLVRPVPQRGTACTLLWYDVYHSKVQDVPTVGIPCTNRWKLKYHAGENRRFRREMRAGCLPVVFFGVSVESDLLVPTMFPAHLADTFLLLRSKSQLLIAVSVIGRMIEDGFQIEVDGAGNACGHVIVQVFETPRYPYLLVCTEMRALLSRFRITEGIDNGQSDVFRRIVLCHTVSQAAFGLSAAVVEA